MEIGLSGELQLNLLRDLTKKYLDQDLNDSFIDFSFNPEDVAVLMSEHSEGYSFFQTKNHASRFAEMLNSIKKNKDDEYPSSTKGFVDLKSNVGCFYWRLRE